MAEQYLNKEGVQTLWSAVKNKISTAQQTVENEFTNGSKVAHTANNANNLGGVAPGGYLKQVKVGNTTYSANNSLISLPSYATLDSSGKVPSSQLPSYVDDVIEGYYSSGKFYYNEDRTGEISGEAGKIYTDLNSNKTYRWGGSAYVEISASLAIGTTTGTAYDGASGAKNASDISSLQNSVVLNSVTSLGSGNVVATSKIVNDGGDGITLSWGQDEVLSAIYIDRDGLSFYNRGTFSTYAEKSDLPTAISTAELNAILV